MILWIPILETNEIILINNMIFVSNEPMIADKRLPYGIVYIGF